MKTIDQKTKCTDTYIQQGKVQSYTKSVVLNKDYLESDIADLAGILQYCAKNCSDLYSCKCFNDMNRIYAKMIRLHRESENEN